MSEEEGSKLKELVSYEGKDRVVHFTDYLLARANIDTGVKRFKSDFLYFDEKCGLETGEVVVLSGYTKAGKTLFAESWCRSMSRNNKNAKPLILSYEVQAEKMLAKYVNDSELPIYVPMGLEAMDFNWLKNRCLEAKLKYGCSIVLIDHLHFLVDMAMKQNMSLNIGGFMRRLKHEIAIGLNMAVLLIAHQGQPKEGQDPSLGNIRDSSFVAQESDATIVIWRRENFAPIDFAELAKKYGEERVKNLGLIDQGEDKYSSGLSMVKIACHRRTGVMDAKKLFRKHGNFLEEV